MKNKIKIPRILKIKSIRGFKVYCIFNNGETRMIDFRELFNKWKIDKKDPEYILLNPNQFRKVKLRNQTLSWENVKIKLLGPDEKETLHPYEIGPDVLYKFSRPLNDESNRYYFGDTIKSIRVQEGISQEELAKISGTSKTYISRIENNLIEPALSTLYKIVEVGLGKKLTIDIK